MGMCVLTIHIYLYKKSVNISNPATDLITLQVSIECLKIANCCYNNLVYCLIVQCTFIYKLLLQTQVSTLLLYDTSVDVL